MATTTPNYGWTVPTSTDLVKDGATAIETLGDAIDASMNTALGTKKAGMVLLQSVAFSAVASQSINDVFSATYTNYLLVGAIKADAQRFIKFRYRVGGADNSTSNYSYQYLDAASGTIVASRGTGGSDTALMYANADGLAGFTCNMFNPFESERTSYYATSNNFSGTSLETWSVTTVFAATTSFTGFTIYPDAGTMTGNVSVYGYNK
jgi:hypothetical protein